MKTYQHHITKVGENVWRLLLQRLFLFCWCCKSEIKPKLHTNDCKKKITILKLFCILQVHVVQVAIIVIVIMIMMMMMTTLTMTMTIIDYYYYLLLPQQRYPGIQTHLPRTQRWWTVQIPHSGSSPTWLKRWKRNHS